MLRRLSTLLSVVSLLLCLGVVALWVRSKSGSDEVIFATAHGRLYWFTSAWGYVSIQVAAGWPNDEPIQWFGHGDPRLKRPMMYATARNLLPDPREHLGVIFMRGPLMTSRSRDGRAIWETPPEVNRDPDPDLPREALPPVAVQFAQTFIPFWIPSTVTALFPAAWLSIRLIAIARVHRRKRHHLCLACGYDLRASPGRCPECGALSART